MTHFLNVTDSAGQAEGTDVSWQGNHLKPALLKFKETAAQKIIFSFLAVSPRLIQNKNLIISGPSLTTICNFHKDLGQI